MQEVGLKAKTFEAICDNDARSVYLPEKIQSMSNKVCFPENGFNMKLK